MDAERDVRPMADDITDRNPDAIGLQVVDTGRKSQAVSRRWFYQVWKDTGQADTGRLTTLNVSAAKQRIHGC